MVIHSRLGRFKSFQFASVFNISLFTWDTPSPARNLSTAEHPVSARKKSPNIAHLFLLPGFFRDVFVQWPYRWLGHPWGARSCELAWPAHPHPTQAGIRGRLGWPPVRPGFSSRIDAAELADGLCQTTTGYPQCT